MDRIATRDSAVAWRADSFRSPADYSLDLDDAERRAVIDAVRRLRDKHPLRPVHDFRNDEFAFGPLGQRLRAAYEDVRNGRGFVVIRGLPVDAITLEEYATAVWGVGTFFGYALSQNAQGELISYALDASKVDPTPRMYRNSMELRPHTDITAMISLACWNKAATGGTSVIVSAVAVHDEIARRAPHLLPLLYEGFHHYRFGEEGPDEEPTTPFSVPVFAVRNGQVSCRYLRTNIAAGHRLRGVPIPEAAVEALNLFDEIAQAPENRLAFDLERGEMIVINNYAVMHARSSFTNHPEPGRERLLVRLWLDAEGFRDVPKEFDFFATNGIPQQATKGVRLDFAQLLRDDPVATGGQASLKVG